MLKVTEERLADKARTILRSNWLTTVELEIKRNVYGDEQRMSSAEVFASACFGNEVLNDTMEEVDSGRKYEDLVHHSPNKCFASLTVRDSLVGLISMPLWTYYTFNRYNPKTSNAKLYLFSISMDIFNGAASIF